MNIKTDIKYLINIIWGHKTNNQKKSLSFHWIRSHIGKSLGGCNEQELRVLRYLLAFKAKNGECPIEEHRDNSNKRYRYSVKTGSVLWKIKRGKVLERANGHCELCWLKSDDLDVDHIIPVFQGGSSEENNLRALCPLCHKRKSKGEARIANYLFKRDKLQLNIELAHKYYNDYLINKYENKRLPRKAHYP